MTVATRFHDLPLRLQLTLVFALLSITTTVIATITLTTLSAQHSEVALRERCARIAQRLQQQLEPVIAFDDHVTARELFASYVSDRELDGIAVYSDSGELIEGSGVRPLQLSSINAPLVTDKSHVIALANIKSRDGRVGRVYVSFSRKLSDLQQKRDIAIAGGFGAAIVLCALFAAGSMSRRMSHRLVRIADAALRLAAGRSTVQKIDDSGKDEIGALATSFNTMLSELERLSLERDSMVATKRERLEALVWERTQSLEQSREMFRLMAESTNAVPFTLDITRGCFPYMGTQGIAGAEVDASEWTRPGILEAVLPRESNVELRQRFDECGPGPFELVATVGKHSAGQREVRWTGTCEWASEAKVLRGLMLDITELRRLSRELSAAQKLESVGRLAAGVAHEINTPVQFVADNVQFIRTSFPDIAKVVCAYRELRSTVNAGGDVMVAAQQAHDAEKAADLDYTLENVPLAIESSMDGLGRIATIVRSMKEFAHPDQAEMRAVDLNQAIRSTLIVARNEYKYLAEVETHFGDLPEVECHLGEINQVVLNLLVNAAHAIADVVGDSGALGKITVRTTLDKDAVEISIGDSGTGIPESARDKIFDPFFTTKEVGKGTGQGLAIAHSVVVKKHRGTLRFESQTGKGTTFFIRLPLDAGQAKRVAA